MVILTELIDDKSTDQSKEKLTPNGYCRICYIQGTKYTCPRCHIPYCSLACYKSEGHADCTEAFYKDSFMDELKNKTVSKEEQKKMESILESVRDYEIKMADLEASHEARGDDIDDLETRLNGLDLDTASPEEILSRLSDEERARFETLLKGGLLQEGLLDHFPKPWWTLIQPVEPKIPSEDEVKVMPQRLTELEAMPFPKVVHPNVIYGLVDLLFSYTYTSITMNEDIEQYPHDTCQLALESSYILSLEPSQAKTFSYTSVEHCLQTLLDLSESRPEFGIEGFLWILGHVETLLRRVDACVSALSHLYRILKNSTELNQEKKRLGFLGSKKVLFITRLVSERDYSESVLQMLLTSVQLYAESSRQQHRR